MYSYKTMLLKHEKNRIYLNKETYISFGNTSEKPRSRWRQYKIVSRSPYSFRKISNIKKYITGHNKQPKTYLKHIPLEPRNTNDCKEELVFFCV